MNRTKNSYRSVDSSPRRPVNFYLETISILTPCRFSLLLVVLTALFLFASGQGQEFVVGLADGKWPVIWYFVVTPLASFQTWFWARAALNYVVRRKAGNAGVQAAYPLKSSRLEHDELEHYVLQTTKWEPLSKLEHWLVLHTPPFLGFAVPFIGGLAVAVYGGGWPFNGNKDFSWPMLVISVASLLIAIALYAFYWYLSPLSEPRSELTRWWTRTFEPHLGPAAGDAGKLKLPRAARWVLWVSVAFFVLAVIWVMKWPWQIGATGGALPVLMLAMATIVPLGTGLIMSSVYNGFPVVTTLLFWAVLVSFLPFADNHAVRVIDPPTDATAVPAPRLTLDEAAAEWAKRVTKNQPGDAKIPLIIVATAGGGSRAAYWTATVLGDIQREWPDFPNLVFAISGVSGGSLGAATWVSLLAQSNPPLATDMTSYGQKIVGGDFLKALAGGFFHPDLVQRFLPLGLPDRAEAIEKAWEHQWHYVMKKGDHCSLGCKDFWGGAEDGFAQPFLSIWQNKQNPPPALFLNGTHEQSGKRIITSNIKIDPAIFLDTYDFYEPLSNCSPSWKMLYGLGRVRVAEPKLSIFVALEAGI